MRDMTIKSAKQLLQDIGATIHCAPDGYRVQRKGFSYTSDSILDAVETVQEHIRLWDSPTDIDGAMRSMFRL